MVALPDVDVSIVIVSYNGRDFLRTCLASIYRHVTERSYEVIVVDNASEDGTPEMVAADFPEATLIRRASNDGFACAANEGIRASQGSYVMLLNPDTEVSNDPLPPMIGYIETHSDVAVLAPKLLDPDGTLQLSCRAFPDFSTALFNRNSLLTRVLGRNRFSRRYLMTDFDHSEIADVDWASAACWLLPRQTIDTIGLLDEGYFWTIEDVDYCQRVHRAGMRVVYFPEVAITHHIGGSSRTATSRAVRERHRGMWRYYKRYLRPGGIVQGVAMDALVWFGIRLRYGWKLVTRSVG